MEKLKFKINFVTVIYIFICFALFICIGGCSKRVTRDTRQKEPPEFIPFTYNISLKDLSGQPVTLDTFKDKVIFLNIWASWCMPCREELPSIERLAGRVKHKDLIFVMASAEEINSIQKFIQNIPMALPFYQYVPPLPAELRDQYIPRTYIIDRYGRIVYNRIGTAVCDTREMQDFLNFLLTSRVKKE